MWSEQVLPVVLTSAAVHGTYMLMPRSFCEWPGLRTEKLCHGVLSCLLSCAAKVTGPGKNQKSTMTPTQPLDVTTAITRLV